MAKAGRAGPRRLDELATAEEWAAVDPRYTSPETSRPPVPAL